MDDSPCPPEMHPADRQRYAREEVTNQARALFALLSIRNPEADMAIAKRMRASLDEFIAATSRLL